ncbi:MAG: TRAP transporter large permease subunit, partial [Xanthobacteraceae bacterium]
VILATLAAPALVQAGVSPMQAHMFVMFNGMLGMVTPPVALAAFAAATIAKSDQWKTGLTATRMSWCCYLIPFLFAYTPALVMNADPLSVALSLSIVLLGILMGTIGVVGFCTDHVPAPYRIAYGVIALMLLVQPAMFEGAIWLNVAGVVLAAAAIAREWMRGRARPRAAPKPQPSGSAM